MGYREYDIKVPVSSGEEELKLIIRKKTGIRNFTYLILRKSLDARNKNHIVWLYRVGLRSKEIRSGHPAEIPILRTERKNREEHILIAGSGPAGLFSALYLAESGYRITLIERGNRVEERKTSLDLFEAGGTFDPANNYAFGEGGAGTFSDGKLTSRTKSIRSERNYIYSQLIHLGAPEEISYMTHPHLGTDNLFRITLNFRNRLEELGCRLLYNTHLLDLKIKNKRICAAETRQGLIEADRFIVATGHSSFDTYRMLIRAKIPFRTKNFALGFRSEHRQQIINLAQWGVPDLPGVKAAEYRLTTDTPDKTPVYSFCMCPGGRVVPSMAYPSTNIVNGMSYYRRDGPWANAAIVAGLNLEKMLKRNISAIEAIDWLENLETSFFNYTGDYKAPACTIAGFLKKQSTGKLPDSSYPFPLVDADFEELLPREIIPSLRYGLQNFCKKLKGYEEGIIIGLESKTSSPIQVERENFSLWSGYPNLYIAGEGSGRAGGIISSAADGLRIALQILSESR